eukprot:scaffold3622_cov144-Skeletonema_menzelii.AAC.3
MARGLPFNLLALYWKKLLDASICLLGITATVPGQVEQLCLYLQYCDHTLYTISYHRAIRRAAFK